MRVKIGDKIILAERVIHVNGSKMMYVMNKSGSYTVEFEDAETADLYFNKSLKDGYIDISEQKYKKGKSYV